MADLKAQLRERDEKIEALTRQVEQLTAALSAMPPAPRGGPMLGRTPTLAASTPATANSIGRPQSAQARTARANSPGRIKMPPSPGRSTITPRSGSPLRRNASGQPAFFHASQRGGPLTEPLPQRGLSQAERENPYENLRGPSLLNRTKFGAKKSDWERFKTDGAFEYVNAFDDDNPFNDPIKYWPFKGWAFPPKDYIGPDDPRETDDLSTIRTGPGNALRLTFAYGYRGRLSRQNLFYNADGRIVYHTAAMGVVYDKETHEQHFFYGHDDDVTALDLHPDKVKVVTGQMGKDPKVLVWSSRPDSSGTLQQLCQISGDHKRAIVGVSFSSTGHYIATMGKDNFRSIAIYKWAKGGAKLDDMRVAIDKGHNDDVFQVSYNPVTDHVVAVGKKFIRFFGLKEGVEEPNSDSRDAKLSKHESNLWAKKGVFGKKGVLQDIMSVAFGSDGVTYVGTADGHIYRFAEQSMDLAVKAHGGLSTKDGKVTALWYNQATDILISSGDDGLLHQWQPQKWGSGGSPSPIKTIDMNKWVSPGLRGPPIKIDDPAGKEDLNTKCGSPAAAHSIHGDNEGRVLLGTVCNEIYEVDFGSNEPPMCYMQGHYDELWGLATHPSKLEFCTASEDFTLRVWDLSTRTMKAMAKLLGPGRCASYSPDGQLIAVGLGSGGKTKGRASQYDGKWLVLESEDLNQVASPPQVRAQRISDIKFSPDGQWVAVGCGDNFIDIYSVSGRTFEHKSVLRGHSSFIRAIDWSVDSTALQSCCGAHELLYWKLFQEDTGKFRPHQEKTSSSMKDVEWHTFSCIFGWPLRGIWPEDSDGTDVNACARSHSAQRDQGLLATADDFGKVKLFRWPCIVPRAQHRPYGGHSSHVTNVSFTHQDKWLISTGGQDRTVFQWQVVSARGAS
ncbi:hypothetical protein AB1Y20_018296 [Prymnesium parvum]|uniref:HELP domain-containing protein n=1 Tax=Prymnesium parvum TaxID=97485 RepID=A0AB34JRJ7_PRYPA